jgi:carboxymethylenebutenolidase
MSIEQICTYGRVSEHLFGELEQSMRHPDLASLQPGINRREFVMSTLCAGFAAAVLPVSAQTITTDTQGLTAGEVRIGDDAVPAYRAMPAEGDTFPVVLVVQEIFGVHEHIKDISRRLAKQGYLAIAPELFARIGDVSKMSDIKEILEKVVSKAADAQVMRDLDDCLRWAQANNGDADKAAVTGFCYGGRITWLYCAHNAKVKAGVAWYGRLKSTVSETQPKHPLDVAAQLHAPVLGLYGGKDQGIPLADVDAMRAALKAANEPSDIVVYPDAQHGFHADYRKSYDARAAQDGWKRMLEWFQRNGVSA